MQNSRKYDRDLTDRQWRLVRKLIPRRKPRGRKPIDRRWILHAILYWNHTGCQWGQLPHDFPRWKTVYTVFRQWRIDGTWQKIHDALREQVGKPEDKKPTPTVATFVLGQLKQRFRRIRVVFADTAYKRCGLPA